MGEHCEECERKDARIAELENQVKALEASAVVAQRDRLRHDLDVALDRGHDLSNRLTVAELRLQEMTLDKPEPSDG